MSANLSAILYLVSGVLFILALRGLSSPETWQEIYLELLECCWHNVHFSQLEILILDLYVLIFLAIGGSIGAFIAYRMAGFHSLVGLAAVFVAISAFINPAAFNLGTPGNIKLVPIEIAIDIQLVQLLFWICYSFSKTTRNNVRCAYYL